ncbi:nuclease [Streptomyces sp. NPDC006733]|uniref:nuclease n=1 Tax=Streptomyces sp. NPDC006733 TaxID=3155460 RepID=UPI0033F54DB1
MPMLVIEGTYRITGARPDGDSIRFYPADPAQWDLVGGRHRVQRNAAGGAQLRLDAIDALETHYVPAHGRELHQPAPYADLAAAELLSWLGFSGVARDGHGTVSAAEPARLPGYLLTRGADLYGRCVALVGKGPAPGPSGERIRVESGLLEETANFHQLAEGLAHPTYYRNLYVGLRQVLTAAVDGARGKGAGLWSLDVTQSGARITGLESITAECVIMPKLFRRLADYLTLGAGDPSLDGFGAFLEQRGDRVLIVSRGQYTGFETVVEVSEQTVRMNRPPEDLVFDEG